MTARDNGNRPAPKASVWHVIAPGEVASTLGADLISGLSSAMAATRLQQDGPNHLGEGKEDPWWEEALESLTEPLQLLLLAVAAIYFWLGERGDALTILVVILMVAAIEVTTELRAKRAVAALSSLGALSATVIRDGKPMEVPAREVVQGDLVILSAGQRVPADLRLIDAAALRINESSLTGEPVSVAKSAQAMLDREVDLAERVTMAYSGCLVTAGKGRGVVVEIGAQSEIGRIAGLVREAREPRTPLQLALNQLSRWLLWFAVGFSVLIPLLGVLVAGRPVKEMLLTGLTLAFATIPEELPILITMVLGLGAYRLAQRRAIVKRLRAAETLGSVSVIATDKTGTLTENRMRVASIVLDGHERPAGSAATAELERRMLTIATLANDAQIVRSSHRIEYLGDPTETALLAAAQDTGLDVEDMQRRFHVLEEYPFSDERKRMSVLVEHSGQALLAAKGSPESMLSICSAIYLDGASVEMDERQRSALLRQADAMAGRGLRVLALAERMLPLDAAGDQAMETVERNLLLLGLIGLEDPPRAEAAEAVRVLRGAGVRVLMITGDHPATAQAIAARVGIEATQAPIRGNELDGSDQARFAQLASDASVFARATPEHKLQLVRSLQAEGQVVAVTGDGVNDAPALREAAIGVAMGQTGTDVARETADLILADDNFATVTEAVRTGRVLYANLRKAVRYYLAAKVALIASSLAAVLLRLPVPFEPVQIIVMELFMDLGAAATFVAEPAEEDVMARPPRDPRQPFMDRAMQLGIVFGGLSLGAAVLLGYLGATQLGSSVAQAQTAAFTAWMIGHVVLAAHMRAERQSLWRIGTLTNRPFLLWAGLALGIVGVASLMPSLQRHLHLTPMAGPAWWLATVAALLLPSWWEPWKWLRYKQTRRSVTA